MKQNILVKKYVLFDFVGGIRLKLLTTPNPWAKTAKFVGDRMPDVLRTEKQKKEPAIY